MEVEKRRPKGGFLNLFDWNGKSRKKLFTNNLELDEGPKRGKENVTKMGKSLLHVIEKDESRGSSSNKGSSEFNCSSSVTSDEACGARGPGVVARLMGLDSLPTSNISEACSEPYRNLHSFRSSQYNRSDRHLWTEEPDCHNVSSREYVSYRNATESRPHKVQKRPIERFQTEILPPKSAKSIPITHHKLLSPVKNPGFVPTKNTAYIMEAASKMIQAGPQSIVKTRRPSVVSSVPLRVWDLRDKMDATLLESRPRKSNEAAVVKRTNRGLNNGRRNNDQKSAAVVKGSMNLDKRSSDNMTRKGKSVREHSMVDIQGREGSASTSSSRSSIKKKEKYDVKANELSKMQLDMQKRTLVNRTNNGTLANRTNNALRQNKLKQNSIPDKDSAASKTLVNNLQNRKTKSNAGSNGAIGTPNKVITKLENGLRKTGSTKNNAVKEQSSSRGKSLTQKKLLKEDSSSEGNNTNHALNKKDARSIKCNVAVDGTVNWSGDNRKKGMEIVSFTFSSPIRSSSQIMEDTNSSNMDSLSDNTSRRYLKNLSFSSLGCNVLDNSALTDILDQKMKEIASKIEFSNCNVIREVSNSEVTFDELSMNSTEQGQRFANCQDISDSQENSCCTSTDSPELKIEHNWQFQQSEEMENNSCGSHRNEPGTGLDSQHSSPVSSLEPSSTSAYYYSDNEHSTADSRQFWFAQNEVEITWCPTNAHQTEAKTYEKHETHTTTDINQFCNHELAYVRDILSNADIMLHKFALGETENVITPSLFNHLENQHQHEQHQDQDQDYFKLARKALFDSVCECLTLRCKHHVILGCKASPKSSALFLKKSLLAEELYREIVSWKNMGDFLVDEVVDKDMSSGYGKWVEFDVEAFEEGVEIESSILTCLIDELVSDLF